MDLEDIITALEAEDPAKVLPLGFSDPHSSRACYEQVAFEPARNVTVGAMLADARGAIGETYCGYKGGEYTMTKYTPCHLAEYGTCGEEIGPTLLRLMLDAGSVPAPPAELTEAQRLAVKVLRAAAKDATLMSYDYVSGHLDDDGTADTDSDAWNDLVQDVTDQMRIAHVDASVSWPEPTAARKQDGEQAEGGR